ncbi:dnaJ homolog subfamily C member 1 [Vanacampus margaritifer]
MTAGGWLRFCGLLLLSLGLPSDAWDADLELLDLVEEIPDTFYRFLALEQDASASEIKKAYRRLSLVLHPDKNKEDDAEMKFRQLVAIYEVLKDEERRRRYDDILVNGLPDWRQPVFYYRRVRKMSNSELAFLLFIIVTVGHYAVIWSIYLEKMLDETLARKKKDKKKKMSAKEDVKSGAADRAQERPHWQDLLPFKVGVWIYLSIKRMPQTLQELQRFYQDYKRVKQQHRREEEEREEERAQLEAAGRDKRSKVKKPKMDFPVYQPATEQPNLQTYQQAGSIQEVEEQLDQWLQGHAAARKKVSEWSADDISLLSRLMGKFPGGTPGRWEKIAHELGRSVPDVTSKVKQAKELSQLSTGLVKLSDLKGPSRPAGDGEQVGALKRRNRKCADGEEGGRLRSRRQKDFDPDEADEEEAEAAREHKDKTEVAAAAWSQNQQKLLELALQQFPRGSAERWDRIAKVVPDKTKEDCMIRCKMLAELVQKRNQSKS